MRFVTVAAANELPEHRGVCVGVGRQELAVFKVGGEVFALDNSCPHRGGPLAEGDVIAGQVFCPLHAWGFDLRTGQSTTNWRARVRTYPVRMVDGQVEVGMDEVDLATEAPDLHEPDLPDA
jgi:NAD(P)H-dependent nitrite reductase small subunit